MSREIPQTRKRLLKATINTMPYDEFLVYMNNTIIAKNINDTRAIVSHSAPYTPRATKMMRS